jgi:hypothetical protein
MRTLMPLLQPGSRLRLKDRLVVAPLAPSREI